MKLAEHKNLKDAIVSLPVKEKDKLLLRLIAKDKVLTEHLHFKLLEEEQDLRERIENLSEEIDVEISGLKSGKNNSKDVLLKMRKLNGRINHHYKVTKDLYSESELRVYLLNQLPLPVNEGIFSPYHKFRERLAVYFIKSALSLSKKYLKLHEDLQYDLKDGLNNILNKIYKSNMASAATEFGLPEKII
jgi:hypothetical protein